MVAVTRAGVPRIPKQEVGVLRVSLEEVGVWMFAVTSAGVPRNPELVIGVLGVSVVEVGMCKVAVTRVGVSRVPELDTGVLGVPSIPTVVFMATTSLDLVCPTFEVILVIAAVSDVKPVMRNYIPVYGESRVSNNNVLL